MAGQRRGVGESGERRNLSPAQVSAEQAERHHQGHHAHQEGKREGGSSDRGADLDCAYVCSPSVANMNTPAERAQTRADPPSRLCLCVTPRLIPNEGGFHLFGLVQADPVHRSRPRSTGRAGGPQSQRRCFRSGGGELRAPGVPRTSPW